MPKLSSDRIKNNLTYAIHEHALPALHFFHEQSYLFNRASHQFNAISPSLNQGITLHAVLREQRHAMIFSGFEYTSFDLAQLPMNDFTLVLYSESEISKDEISNRAWKGVIRSTITSIDARKLDAFRRKLNQTMPKAILKKVFNKNAVSQSYLADISVLSRSAFAQQHSNATKNQPSPLHPHYSVFDTLVIGRAQNEG